MINLNNKISNIMYNVFSCFRNFFNFFLYSSVPTFQILDAITSLPLIEVQLRVKVDAVEEEPQEQQAGPVVSTAAPWTVITTSSRNPQQHSQQRSWIPVPCGATCTLEVFSRRLVKRKIVRSIINKLGIAFLFYRLSNGHVQ